MGRYVLAGVVGLTLIAGAVRARGAQKPEAGAGVVLTVRGEVQKPLELTAADLAKLPRQTVQARDHQGQDAVFEGVALADVLKEAGVPLGTALRGPAVALYLVVEASDGYRAVFALPELDPAYTDRVVLLADRRDRAAMKAPEGPLRVVVPGEKRHARWVRQVITLRVGRA